MKEMTIEEWKEGCKKSGHLRPGETVEFREPDRDGIVAAYVPGACHNGSSLSLGFYFTRDVGFTKGGRGWFHDY